jgi:hypothetical protein
MEWRGKAGGRRPGAWGGRDGRLRIAALFNGRTEVHGLFSSQSVAEKGQCGDRGEGGGWWRRAGAGGGSGVPAGRRRPGLLFAPFGGRFRDRGAGALCFVLARAPHAVGRGTVRCRAGASHRWGGDVRGPGSGGRGWRALGCARCLRGRGGGAAASGPTLQGFGRARRQRVSGAEEAG